MNTKALVIRNSQDYISDYKLDAFFNPLRLYKQELKNNFSFSFDQYIIDTTDENQIIKNISRYSFDPYDIIIFLTGKNHNLLERGIRAFQDINIKKIIFDLGDSTGAALFNLIPLVDLYVKKQLLKDISLYKQPLHGGRIYSHFLSDRFQDISTNPATVLANGDESKLCLGWNIANYSLFANQFLRQGMQAYHNNARKIDVYCRLSQSKDAEIQRGWHWQHRQEALTTLRKLGPHINILAEDNICSFKRCRAEMRNSKISVSPFSWGDINFRDLDAIICGALLIKTDTSYMETHPDLFIPYETYVPVKWDFSDLNDKCLFYLKNNQLRQEIVINAQSVYAKYFNNTLFIENFEKLLNKI